MRGGRGGMAKSAVSVTADLRASGASMFPVTIASDGDRRGVHHLDATPVIAAQALVNCHWIGCEAVTPCMELSVPLLMEITKAKVT